MNKYKILFITKVKKDIVKYNNEDTLIILPTKGIEFEIDLSSNSFQKKEIISFNIKDNYQGICCNCDFKKYNLVYFSYDSATDSCCIRTIDSSNTKYIIQLKPFLNITKNGDDINFCEFKFELTKNLVLENDISCEIKNTVIDFTLKKIKNSNINLIDYLDSLSCNSNISKEIKDFTQFNYIIKYITAKDDDFDFYYLKTYLLNNRIELFIKNKLYRYINEMYELNKVKKNYFDNNKLKNHVFFAKHKHYVYYVNIDEIFNNIPSNELNKMIQLDLPLETMIILNDFYTIQKMNSVLLYELNRHGFLTGLILNYNLIKEGLAFSNKDFSYLDINYMELFLNEIKNNYSIRETQIVELYDKIINTT